MYNYYKHLSLINDNKLNEEVIKKEEHIDKTRQIKNKRLINNYENKVKQFMYKMANKNYEVKDISRKVNNTREEFLQECSNMIKGKTGFSFSNFLTDKERIEKIEKEKRELEKFQNPLKKLSPNKKEDKKTNMNMTLSKRLNENDPNFDIFGHNNKDKDIIEKDLKNNTDTNFRKVNNRFKNVAFNNKDKFIKNQDKSLGLKTIEPSEDMGYIMYSHKKRTAVLEQNGFLPKTLKANDPVANYESNIDALKKQLNQRDMKNMIKNKNIGKTYFKATNDLGLSKSFYDNDLIKRMNQTLKRNKEKQSTKNKGGGLLNFGSNKLNETVDKNNKTLSNFKTKVDSVIEYEAKLVKAHKDRLRNIKSKFNEKYLPSDKSESDNEDHKLHGITDRYKFNSKKNNITNNAEVKEKEKTKFNVRF